MSVEAFLDTNILVYQLDALDARKHRIADDIVGQAVATGGACISFQVLQECLNVVLRKAQIKLDSARAGAYLDTVLSPLCKVHSSIPLYERALGVHQRWQYAFYDSLIIAAALEAGCTRLLSEDLHDGQRVETLTIENPFRLR